MNATRDLVDIVAHVERELATFYGFDVRSSAADHLVTLKEIHRSFGDDAIRLPEFQARGSVWLQEGGEDDVFIGLYLHEHITDILINHDPTTRLADTNLDAFCVMVEEVSHFHLILDRLEHRRGVSKLELEWQGEIDKLLVAALTLQRQSGDPHLSALARRIFDTATITAGDHELYWLATKYAARFWYGVLSSAPGGDAYALNEHVRDFLQRNYRASWTEKLTNLSAPQKIRKAG